EKTIDEIPNANATNSFTAAAASNRTITLAQPVYLGPGIYVLVLRNTSGANTWGIATLAVSVNYPVNPIQTQTLGAGLGATLDAVTGWTKANSLPGARLQARVLGQTAPW